MVKDNILRIKGRIAAVCSKINSDQNRINIVAVSKGRTIEQIREVIEAGITDIGENRVQEAALKHHELRTTNYELKWHLVGHLQTNKVKDALNLFGLIHSVDSLRLAEEIDKQAAKIDKIQDILVEVNTSGEISKFGLKPDEADKIIEDISKLTNIKIKGLMTIAPLLDNPEKARPYFRLLKELYDKVNRLSTINYQLSTLSMGMTDDFEVAIEEGANMLRLGRAIFEV